VSQIEYWVIGCGNMGGALVRGALAANSAVVALDADPEKIATLKGLGALEASDSSGDRRAIILAVKPHQIKAVVHEFDWRADDVLISIAAGLKLEEVRAALPDAVRSVVACGRAMPNTPAMVGKGVTGFWGDDGSYVALPLFEAVGEVVKLGSEEQFHALIGISGSGPAYMFMALEALSDGGVRMGLDRASANRLAIMTMAGAAELARETGTHFELLKDQVTSPGGTTIAACAELERLGFRYALNQAVFVAAERSKSMSEKLS